MNVNEYNYHFYSPGKWYTSPLSIVADNGSNFTSLYGVAKADAEAIVTAGTTRGFKGVVWSEKLWIDVDSYEGADRTEERLRKLGLAFVAYDSGGKGAHFGVDRIAFPSHLLPYSDREWTKSNIADADLSLYSHLHLLRMEGTVHEETGRLKKLVVAEKGKKLSLPLFKFNEGVVVSFLQGGASSVFDCFRVMANSVPASNGQRHSQLVRLLYALKDQAQVNRQAAEWWCLEVNKMFEDPKSEEEILKVVDSIYGV